VHWHRDPVDPLCGSKEGFLHIPCMPSWHNAERERDIVSVMIDIQHFQHRPGKGFSSSS